MASQCSVIWLTTVYSTKYSFEPKLRRMKTNILYDSLQQRLPIRSKVPSVTTDIAWLEQCLCFGCFSKFFWIAKIWNLDLPFPLFNQNAWESRAHSSISRNTLELRRRWVALMDTCDLVTYGLSPACAWGHLSMSSVWICLGVRHGSVQPHPQKVAVGPGMQMF